MEKSDSRVQSHRFQCRPDIVHEKSVDERQKAVDIVQRRPSVSLIEMKGFLLGNDQMIEHVEIDMGGVSFDPAQHIQRLFLIEEFKHGDSAA